MIFYKGCPLRCQWCSNPESQSFSYSVMYDRTSCKSFGDCLSADDQVITRIGNNGIQIRRENIKEPERINGICPSKALTLCGESSSVEEIITEIEKDSPFYRESGGVTLSGGEPLSQGEELITLLRKLKERSINVNMETSLHVRWEMIERCLGLVNTFLVDLKHLDQHKFDTYARGDAEMIMKNIKKLTDSESHVIIRVPVIPGFNHTSLEMNRMIDFAASLEQVSEIHFLPYHTFGKAKYEMLGMDYLMGDHSQVEDSELEPYIRYAQLKGLETRIGG